MLNIQDSQCLLKNNSQPTFRLEGLEIKLESFVVSKENCLALLCICNYVYKKAYLRTFVSMSTLVISSSLLNLLLLREESKWIDRFQFRIFIFIFTSDEIFSGLGIFSIYFFFPSSHQPPYVNLDLTNGF